MNLEEEVSKQANNLVVERTFPRCSPGNIEPERSQFLKLLVARIVKQENMKKRVAIIAALDSAEVRIELGRSVSHHQRRGPAIKRVFSARCTVASVLWTLLFGVLQCNERSPVITCDPIERPLKLVIFVIVHFYSPCSVPGVRINLRRPGLFQ